MSVLSAGAVHHTGTGGCYLTLDFTGISHWRACPGYLVPRTSSGDFENNVTGITIFLHQAHKKTIYPLIVYVLAQLFLLFRGNDAQRHAHTLLGLQPKLGKSFSVVLHS